MQKLLIFNTKPIILNTNFIILIQISSCLTSYMSPEAPQPPPHSLADIPVKMDDIHSKTEPKIM